MSARRREFIHELLDAVGSPYLWGGKGYEVFDVQKGLVSHALTDTLGPLRVFDCSGLVTWALKRAGGPDWRASHNAQALFDAGRYPQVGDYECGRLLFYGDNVKAITHVAVSLGSGLKVEAGGGDASVRTVLEAMQRGARVAARWENRSDAVGQRMLPDAVLSK